MSRAQAWPCIQIHGGDFVVGPTRGPSGDRLSGKSWAKAIRITVEALFPGDSLELFNGPDKPDAKRAMQAVLTMAKLDIAALG